MSERPLFYTDANLRTNLRAAFEPAQIGKLPATAKRPELDFVGHAAVTDRLNKWAPDTTWRVLKWFAVGETVWIHGEMTVGGVTREEFGDGSDLKEAMGNFIRRAAMRFGVALDLWSRQELETSDPIAVGADNAEDGGRDASPTTEPTAPPSPATPDQWERASSIGLSNSKVLLRAKERFGVTKPEQITAEQMASIISEAWS